MSWFYSALKEAAKNAQPATRLPTEWSADEGGLLLDTLQAVAPMAGKPCETAPEISAVPSTDDVRSPDRARSLVEKEDSTFHNWNNAFRHLTVEIEDEARLVLRSNPHSLAAEQFRFLRQRLSQHFKEGGVLLVTSPGEGDGKTLTSINLCSAFSELGQSTLLVEVDVHRPSIAKVLNCTIKKPGVESAFCGKASPERVVHALDNLSFHAAMVAKIANDAAPQLNRTGVKDFLVWARQRFHWVVLDAPPAMFAADVADVLPFTDGAILVIRAQYSPRAMTRLALQTLGSHLRGVIFNETSVHSSPHYKYLDTYYASPQRSPTDSEQRDK